MDIELSTVDGLFLWLQLTKNVVFFLLVQEDNH